MTALASNTRLQHEHDEPGWESDCHLCHLDGIGDPRDCHPCHLFDGNEPREDCEDCCEAVADLWERLRVAY